MPTSTAWRRRNESTPRRGSSPERPRADSIERLSPEPVPTTPTRPHNSSSRKKREQREQREPNGHPLQGLGLSHTALSDKSVPDPDHLYLDEEGRAHLGAKVRSPKHNRDSDHATTHTARRASAKASTTQYRGPPKRGHTRAGSTIDDLANIAIATSPEFTSSNTAFHFGGSPIFHSTSRPNTSYINGYSQDSFDRPAKRIKSERFHPMEWSEPQERPRSSYTYQPEVRKEDAELLLSLQNGFSFKSLPQPAAPAPKTDSIPDPLQYPQLQNPFESGASEIEEEGTAKKDAQHVPETSRHDLEHEPSVPHPLPAVDHEMPEDNDQKMEDVEVLDHTKHDAEQETEGATEPGNDNEELQKPPPIQAATGTAEHEVEDEPQQLPQLVSLPDIPQEHQTDAAKKSRRVPIQTQPVCPTCDQMQYNGREGEATIDWIKCEGSCNRWFHIPCAGFSDHEVKKVAKFICKDCEPKHGQTTYARTSTRARAAPDYAALNEGVMKSSEDTTMHHFVPKFKDGTIKYHTDNFARIRPELLTTEFWENMDGMKRPFVVPACWNPRFGETTIHSTQLEEQEETEQREKAYVTFTTDGETLHESNEQSTPTSVFQTVPDEVLDVDQDYLDMVMPRHLTVRKVAELYGPDEPVPVIEVKTQETKGKFTLRQWANYYEETGSKPIRNVISLEVSHSRLGRLIRRPKVVRDIDLEAQVWDPQSRADGKKRPIAFYCLMSVGDSYTDFHIDFGGSSVYYHILKGMKTFFFIPPTEKYLKKYEEWNNSPNQNETWLPDLCDGNVTRVDLRPGDTAFIPAGWIHSVWTPEDSLVIGGNFLTRYDLDAQIRVTQIEKATNVAPSFRYPFFQKVMWYTLMKYLDDDPVPESVIRDFQDDPEYRYLRARPVWADHDIEYTVDNEPDEADFNARNYSKSELKGLPALRDYLYRTARIYADLPVENINKKQIDAVKASVPKNHGDPLQQICEFAVWVAWKTGNVTVPDWVHSDSVLQQELDKRDKDKVKKPEVFRIPPERASTRRKNQGSPAPLASERQESPETRDSKSPTDASNLPYPRIACANCRKKRQKCQHQPGSRIEESAKETLEKDRRYSNVTIDIAKLARASPVVPSVEASGPQTQPQPQPQPTATAPSVQASVAAPASIIEESTSETIEESPTMDLAQAALARMNSQPPESNGILMNGATPTPGSAKKGRSKACEECRKSKRRCVHDEHGRVDPAKAAEPSKPRGSASGKRPARISDEHQHKKVKSENISHDDNYPVFMPEPDIDAMIDPALMAPIDPMLGLQYHQPPLPIPDINVMSRPPQHPSTQNNMTMPNGPVQPAIDPNLDPALANQSAIDPSLDSAASFSDQPQAALPAALPQLRTAAISTPNVDKSFSPITAESAEARSKHESEEDQSYPAQSTTENNGIDGAMANSQVNGADHAAAAPVVEVKQESKIEQRRPSTTATASSPKAEVKSSPARRTSSHTSGTIHQAAVTQRPTETDTITANHSPKQETNSQVKEEAATPAREVARAETAVSESSEPEDPSERLARELQASEHGLRRRPSVRIS
ncbi:JmjC domain-containing histone demethylation protein 1 [Knufia obscura]|uniref:JmjC domain-containing histone demethylation protein 1 n=2 Tax=Knufia TaxID=430999 RepID=A0AAN8EQI4_9EURO|nr:JmjC domain-containing histone demethylation protein 1 [Knufia obscura]KAK5956573.1 JmjC domain-containing histone demethylation protein 1 [Knufia fluminis]